MTEVMLKITQVLNWSNFYSCIFFGVLSILHSAGQIFPGAQNGLFLKNAKSSQLSIVLNSDTAMWTVSKANKEEGSHHSMESAVNINFVSLQNLNSSGLCI